MTYYLKADSVYMAKLHEKLATEHNKMFVGREKNYETAIESLKYWGMQMPRGNTHPADMCPKTASRFYICSKYIHEVIRYLHFIDKFEEAQENLDVCDLLNTEYLMHIE